MTRKRSTKSNVIPAAGPDVTLVSASGAITSAAAPAKVPRPRKPRVAKAGTNSPALKSAQPEQAPAKLSSEQAHAYPQEEIARLAYSLWEQRGSQPGSPLEDWLRAEQELLSR